MTTSNLALIVLTASLTTGNACSNYPCIGRRVAFSADDAWIVWGAEAGKVHLHSFGASHTPGKDHVFIGGNGSSYVTEVAFSPDSKMIAVASADQVRLHSLTSGGPPVLKQVVVTSSTVTSMAFSPASLHWLAVACIGSTAFDNKSVRIYDLQSPQGPTLKHVLTKPAKCEDCVEQEINSVAFSRDAKWLAVDYQLDEMRMYAVDTDSGAPELRFTLGGRGDEISGSNSVSFSPDSTKMATAYLQGGTSIYTYHDQSSPSPGGWAPKQDGIGPPSAFAAEYSPDGKWLATGGFHQYVMAEDGPGVLSVNAVDSEGRTTENFSFTLAKGDSVDAVAFSSDSKWLAVTSSDNKARIFSVASGTWELKYTLEDTAKPDEQPEHDMVV